MEEDVVTDDDADFAEAQADDNGVGGSTGATGPAVASSPGVGGADSGCAAGEQLCDTQCVDVSSNTAHCGACNTVCGLGENCNGGQCVPGGSGSSSSGTASSSSSGTASSSSSGNPSSSSSGGAAMCNPMAPAAACGAAMHCVPSETGTPSCDGPAGNLVQYDACSASADCSADLECMSTPFATVYCLQWCTNDLDCPSLFDTCNFLSPALYAGATEYGVCYDGLP
jgi:hypothetical protein